MENTNQKQFAFERGWEKVPKKIQRIIKKKIMEGLELRTISAFYCRLRGEVEPKITEHLVIETAFKKHGVTDIWGGYEHEDSN